MNIHVHSTALFKIREHGCLSAHVCVCVCVCVCVLECEIELFWMRNYVLPSSVFTQTVCVKWSVQDIFFDCVQGLGDSLT